MNSPLNAGSFAKRVGWVSHLDREIAENGQPQVVQQETALGVRISAHAAPAYAGEVSEFRMQLAGLVE